MLVEEFQSEPAWRDLTLSIEQVIRLGLRWLPAITALSFIPYFVLHGLPDVSWPDSVGVALVRGLIWIVVAVLIYGVSALFHEIIHVVGMISFAQVPLASIRFGFRPRDGVLYVHTDEPMSARAYQSVLLLPAVVQGILPVAFGSVFDIGWLVLYGYVMLLSAIGDLAVFQLIHHLESRDLVRDHPTAVGCQVWR
jgi:hypothetical protein